MIDKDVVRNIIEDLVQEKEAYIVEIKVSSSNQINVEIDSFSGFTINDCVEVSRLIESKLDRETEDFELEVASASLSAPFKVLKQYEKNLGEEVETLTSDGKKLIGILSDVTDADFEIEESKMVKVEGKKKKQPVTEKHRFKYDEVKSTKIVIKFK